MRRLSKQSQSNWNIKRNEYNSLIIYIHAVNEQVNIRNLVDFIKVMIRFIFEWYSTKSN